MFLPLPFLPDAREHKEQQEEHHHVQVPPVLFVHTAMPFVRINLSFPQVNTENRIPVRLVLVSPPSPFLLPYSPKSNQGKKRKGGGGGGKGGMLIPSSAHA